MNARERRTILLVDDDPSLVRVLAQRMRTLDVDVITAGSAFQAFELMRTQRPDLAIVDVDLPGESGFSLCNTMIADMRLSCVPVIVLTGLEGPKIRTRCENLGAHYVHKSLDCWERLRDLIETFLACRETASRPSRRVDEQTRLPDRTGIADIAPERSGGPGRRANPDHASKTINAT